VPTKPVKNVKVSRIDNGRVTISWTPLSYVEARGLPLYTVSYMSDGNVMGSASTLNSSIIIPGLSQHRTYTFTIQVSTQNGTAETTSQVTLHGEAGSPASAVGAAVAVLLIVIIAVIIAISIVVCFR
jgi:hypothetical protein